jgi:hypothetical protein
MPPAAQPSPPPEPSPAEPAAPDAADGATLGVPPNRRAERDRRAEQAAPPPAEAPPGLGARQQPLAQAQAKAKAGPARGVDPAHQQRTVAAFFLAVLSLFGVLGLSNFQRGVYIVVFALAAGVMAIWLAGTAIRRSRRGGTAGPRGSVVAIAIGGAGVLVSSLLLAGFALLGHQASAFSQCLSGANTVAAQQTCQNQFMRAVRNATP